MVFHFDQLKLNLDISRRKTVANLVIKSFEFSILTAKGKSWSTDKICHSNQSPKVFLSLDMVYEIIPESGLKKLFLQVGINSFVLNIQEKLLTEFHKVRELIQQQNQVAK